MRQMLTVGEIKHGDAFIGLELAENFSNQRRAGWAERFRCLQAHQTRGRGHIRLPATPNDRVAMKHQEAVAWIKGGCGIEGPWCSFKVPPDSHAYAINLIEPDPVIAGLAGDGMERGK